MQPCMEMNGHRQSLEIIKTMTFITVSLGGLNLNFKIPIFHVIRH